MTFPTFGTLFGQRFGNKGIGSSYFWDDDFTISKAAPLPNPMQADIVGLADIFDPNLKMSKSGGKLVIAATVAADNPFISDHFIRPRTSGLAFLFEFTPAFTSERWVFGWAPTQASGNINCLSFRPAGVFDVIDNGIAMVNATNIAYSAGVSYKGAIVQKILGCDLYIKGGAISDWIKLFSTTAGNASVYALATATTSAAQVGSMDFCRVRQLSSFFSQPNGATIIDAINPTTGQLFNTVADAVHVMKLSLPGSPNAGDTITLEYRRQDASNKWLMRMVRNAGNTAWDLQVRKVVATVELTPGTWADVTGVGNVDTFEITTQGNAHTISTKTGVTWTQRNATISDSFNNTNIGLSPVFAVGSVSALQSGARTNAAANGAFSELDAV